MGGGRKLLALALAALVARAAGLYESDGDVVMLDSGNFHEVVADSNAVVAVEFFAPWCGHCQKLAPDYARVAKSLKDIIVVGAVDCEAEKKLCTKFGVKGFPTIKVFAGEKTKNPYTGKVERLPQDYVGPTTAGGLAKALKSALPVHLDTIASPEDWAAFREKASDGLPSTVLATTAKSTTPLYKSLAMRFRQRMHFAEVHSDIVASLDGLEVEAFPQLSVTTAAGERHIYDGELQASLLVEFLEGLAAPPPEDNVSEAGDDKDQAAAKEPEEKVVLGGLDAGEFDAKVLQQELPVLIAFFGGGDGECDEAVTALESALAPVKGMLPMFKLRVAPGEASQELAAGLSDDSTTLADALAKKPCSPKVAVFPFGVEAKEEEDPEVFAGDVSDSKELKAFIFDTFPELVVRLNKMIINEFFATEITKPKMILLTNKDETPGMYKALAMNFKGEIVFGEIHKNEQEAVAMFPNPKFPGMFLAVPSEKQGDVQLIPVVGPLQFPFLSSMLAQSIGKMRPQAGEEPQDRNVDGAAGGVVEVDTQAGFQEACLSQRKLCVIAFLDTSKDNLEEQLNVARKVAAKHGSRPLSFQWMDGRKQPDFAAALDVKSSDLPTVSVLSPHKRRYATLKGVYSQDSMVKLLDGVVSSKTKTHTIQDIPLVHDGGVEVLEEDVIEEEEFDLSDIMGEEVEEIVTSEQKLKELDEQLRRQQEEAAAEAAKAKKTKGKGKGKGKKNKSKSKSKKDEL